MGQENHPSGERATHHLLPALTAPTYSVEQRDEFCFAVLYPNPDAGKKNVCYSGARLTLCTTDGQGDADLIAGALNAQADMLEALKIARECIAYCRRAHKDAQSGTGFPVEILIDAAITRATGAQS